VHETLGDLPEEFVDDVLLLVSELATNSVRHARSAFELGLELDLRSLRIEITDQGGDLPRKRSPLKDEPYGRGLHIVDSLAESWGVGVAADGGKTIWVVVPIPGTGATEVAGAPQVGALQRPHFDDVVPGWLFALGSVWQRVLLGVAAPLLVLPLLASVEDPAKLRPGAFLAVVLVGVTCVGGGVTVVLAGAGLTLEFWYYGLSPTRSFGFGQGTLASVIGLSLLVLALAALAFRLERTVDEVRLLDNELR
jgi:hypothetical protein